jgi:drug/metabolite transporter (DMT)-like permease
MLSGSFRRASGEARQEPPHYGSNLPPRAGSVKLERAPRAVYSGSRMGPPARTRRNALAFLSVGALCTSFAPILIRLCRYPAPAVASLRMLLAGLLLLPFCLGDLRLAFREQGVAGFVRLLAPGLLLSAHFQCWVLSLRHTSVANATFIFSLNPVLFAVVERFGSRRRLAPSALVSLALALAGALWLFLLGGGRLGRLGDLLALAATLLYVSYLLAARRFAGRVPHLAFAQTLYFWGGLAGLAVAALAGSLAEVRPGDAGSLAALAGLVLLPTLVGHTSINYGVRHLAPLTVSFFSLSEPLIATSAAALLLGEPLRPRELPAYGLFLAATLLYLLLAARAGDAQH